MRRDEERRREEDDDDELLLLLLLDQVLERVAGTQLATPHIMLLRTSFRDRQNTMNEHLGPSLLLLLYDDDEAEPASVEPSGAGATPARARPPRNENFTANSLAPRPHIQQQRQHLSAPSSSSPSETTRPVEPRRRPRESRSALLLLAARCC